MPSGDWRRNIGREDELHLLNWKFISRSSHIIRKGFRIHNLFRLATKSEPPEMNPHQNLGYLEDYLLNLGGFQWGGKRVEPVIEEGGTLGAMIARGTKLPKHLWKTLSMMGSHTNRSEKEEFLKDYLQQKLGSVNFLKFFLKYWRKRRRRRRRGNHHTNIVSSLKY